MAIAFDAASAVPGDGSPSATKTYTGHSVTGNNTVLFVAFFAISSSDSVTGVTWGGTAMTQLAKQQLYSNRWHYVYGLVGAATGAHNVVASFSPNDGWDCPQVVSYTGVKQTGLPDTVLIQGAGSTTFSISRTSVADNCWMGAFIRAFNIPVVTSSGDVTRSTTAAPDYSIWVDSNGPITPAGSHTISGTCANSGENAQMAVTFAPASATTGGNNLMPLMGLG